MTVLLVALGAAVGAPLRFLTDRVIQEHFRPRLPWGTFVVNVAGSFLLGLLVGLPAGSHSMALLGTGFCGALTTYSTFSYETLQLLRSGASVRALLYVLASLAAGLGAACLGVLLACESVGNGSLAS